MPTENRILSESYHVPLHNSIVTIETTEESLDDNTHRYLTMVCWENDADEDVIFESQTREAALQRHERLCRFFRKYQWFWKPVKHKLEERAILMPAF